MKDNSDRDYLGELARLRARYPQVAFISRITKPGEKAPGELIVRFRAKNMMTMEAKILRSKKLKGWHDLFEIEEGIQKELAARVKQERKANRALITGKAIIDKLGGTWAWVNGNYIGVQLPATEATKSWRGWLQFFEWDGRSPRRRQWSYDTRRSLHSMGCYAWRVAIDLERSQAKLYYAGVGNDRPFASEWFILSADNLQAKLIEYDMHADAHKWREREMLLVEREDEFGVPVQRPISPRQIRREAKRARDQRRDEAEVDRFRAEQRAWLEEKRREFEEEEKQLEEELGNDPNSPSGWDGSLGKRYVDD